MPKDWKPSPSLDISSYSTHSKSSNGSYEIDTISLYNQGKYQEMIEACDRFLREDPDYANFALALNNKGVAFKSLGNIQQALDCYYKAIEKDPNCIEAIYNIGYILHGQGKYHEAIYWYIEP